MLIVLAHSRLLWRRDSDVVRGVAAWWVVSFIVVGVLGNTGAGGDGLTVLPAGYVAGFGAVELFAVCEAFFAIPAWSGSLSPARWSF
ncbi:MAG: hypothetical protein R3A46_06710 [Thermomicrobiales bacterium]